MKGKDRDELLRYSFGDLNDAELLHVQARIAADPDLEREALAVGEIRDGLRSMRQVPECQVSVERVRDAILRKEMDARKPSIWRLGVTIAPIAATFLAVAVFVRLQNQGTMEQMTSEMPIAISGMARSINPEADSPYMIVDPTESAVGEPLRSVEPDPVPVAGTPTRTERKVSVSLEGAITPSGRTAESPPSRGGMRVALATDAATNTQPSAASTMAADNTSVEESPTVVIITSEESLNTGARMASEVETSNHVLIGS